MSSSHRFQHLFCCPKPKNPTLFQLLDPLNQIKYPKPDAFGFMEIFGEIYFDERSAFDINLVSSMENISYGDSVSSSWDSSKEKCRIGSTDHNYGFSKYSLETFPDCNEGLGFESYNMLKAAKNNKEVDSRAVEKGHEVDKSSKSIEKKEINVMFKRLQRGKGFPPHISYIRSNGNPRFCMKSYRYEGRLILKVISIPPQELLDSSQEDGTLNFSFLQPSDDSDGNEVEDREENNEGEEKEMDAEDKAEMGNQDTN